jgi:hypothetical protein
MARSTYIYYAQSKRHPSDPAYSAAFTVKHELISWLGSEAHLYQVWRMSDGVREGSSVKVMQDLSETSRCSLKAVRISSWRSLEAREPPT